MYIMYTEAELLSHGTETYVVGGVHMHGVAHGSQVEFDEVGRHHLLSYDIIHCRADEITQPWQVLCM